MKFLAHSAKDEIPAQEYEKHIKGVFTRASKYADEAEKYCREDCSLKDIVQRSALWHDLGKLDDKNQEILHEESGKHLHLPINHVDAGCAMLSKNENLLSALAVYSHHKGLPDISVEECRDACFRDLNGAIRRQVDEKLEELTRRHKKLVRLDISGLETPYNGNTDTIFLRMVLSCLADGDHTDTAVNYGKITEDGDSPKLRAKERLEALNQYVSTLVSDDKERGELRQKMYLSCRDAETKENFTICDSPVGSGKTTAVMAHLLRQAANREARRVFVILPYTSIIRQSVEVYRTALTLPGEDPERVVAELHCRADFQEKETRYLTSQWRAPIVVATAVTFFETLASNRPAALRRLHELPGSVIFVDEAHNALPLKLLPLAWKWMNGLADAWSCYWVLASGSLVRYWDLEQLRDIEMPRPRIQELVCKDLRGRLMQYEKNRISFCWRSEPLTRTELVEWIRREPGPRLLILNTVQSAAVIASDLYEKYKEDGKNSVEHLSTSLTPEDREKTIRHVKSRLKDSEDTDWTLVATSCVEAGVDFSFKTGFREISSLLSLLQAAGRVNRDGKNKNARMWSFSLQDDSCLKRNPGVSASSEVLKEYFVKGVEITPELSTQSMNKEIVHDDSCLMKIKSLMEKENNLQFPEVNNEFKVIDSDTVLAVIDDTLAKEIAHREGKWQQLQKKAVSIRREKVGKWNLEEIVNGIYKWTLPYDSFIGYMRGVIELEKVKSDVLLY